MVFLFDAALIICDDCFCCLITVFLLGVWLFDLVLFVAFTMFVCCLICVASVIHFGY